MQRYLRRGHGRSSKQLEEAPSKAIIFQTFHLNNLSTRYFKMKIFFALALVVFGFTWSVVLACDNDGDCVGVGLYCRSGVCVVNIVEENASGVGGWGGTCRCPDGTTYEVGDNKDGCGTLACVNGEKVNCYEYDGEWSNRKVTCGCEDLGDRVWIPCGNLIPNFGCTDWYVEYYCRKSCGFC